MKPQNSPRLLLTAIKEGTCIETTLFGSRPKFIMAYEGWDFDWDWNVINTSNWYANDIRWDSIQPRTIISETLRNSIGTYWVGIPPRMVVERKKQWQEWRHPTGSSEREIWRREDNTRFFFIKRFDYAFKRLNVETSETIKVDIEFTVFVGGTNPYTALVKNDDWFSQLEGFVLNRVRDYVGMRTLIEVLAEHPLSQAEFKKNHALGKDLPAVVKVDDDKRPSFSDFFADLSKENLGTPETEHYGIPGKDGHSTKKVLGIEVFGATIESVDVSAGQQAIVDAFLARARERAEGDGLIEKKRKEVAAQEEENKKIALAATAEANRVETVAQGRAKALNLETSALARRVIEVDEKILSKEGGALVLASRAVAEAATAQAEAVKANENLTTVVFSGGGATPVIPLGK